MRAEVGRADARKRLSWLARTQSHAVKSTQTGSGACVLCLDTEPFAMPGHPPIVAATGAVNEKATHPRCCPFRPAAGLAVYRASENVVAHQPLKGSSRKTAGRPLPASEAPPEPTEPS
jgi:hypothetical protein